VRGQVDDPVLAEREVPQDPQPSRVGQAPEETDGGGRVRLDCRGDSTRQIEVGGNALHRHLPMISVALRTVPASLP